MIRRTPCPQGTDLAGLFLLAPQLPDDGRDCYAGYSRFALLNLFRALGFAAGTKVLLPAYICDVLLLPFAELGIEPVYYGITDDFQVAWESVWVVPGVRAMITVNYFGISLDYPDIAAFAERHGLLWINDNAHGFASSLNGRGLEEFGHVSVTSFRKVIPALNGSHLRLNRDDLLPLKGTLDRLNNAGREEAPFRYVASGILRRLGLRLRSLPDFSVIDAFRDRDGRKFRLAPGAARTYCVADRDVIREHRKVLYATVTELLADGGYPFLEFLPDLLREDNSPLVFPVTVRDPLSWKKILARSRQAGIDIHTWPSLPENVAAGNILGCADRWRRTLCIPLHQDMEMVTLIARLKKVLDAI